jgi:hypothetical protein
MSLPQPWSCPAPMGRSRGTASTVSRPDPSRLTQWVTEQPLESRRRVAHMR